MSLFENIQLETNGEGEKITREETQTAAEEIADIQNHLTNISESKDPEIQKKLKNTNLSQEVLQFLEQAGNNALASHLSEFNARKFDKDNEAGLDKFEFEQFQKALNGAIEQIIIFDGLGTFSEVHKESEEQEGLLSLDKFSSQIVDFQEHILGDETENTFTKEGLKRLGLTEEDLQKMAEKKFDPTNFESYKETGILVSKEIGEGVEMILRTYP